MNISCTSMESTNLRQFIIVNKIIIIISVVHFPNELNQKRSQYPHWSCDYKLPKFSLTLNRFFAFHTNILGIVPLNQLLSLAGAKISPVCKLEVLPKFSNFFQISLCHFNLYSTNTRLS